VEQQSASEGAQLRAQGGAAAQARTVLDDTGIRRSLMRIAHEMVERVEAPERLYLVAIPNGGVPLARHLAANLAEVADLDVPVGVLDTTLYRDDLLTTGERPALRAAMDALMDFGRPRAVQVVGLVDRGHRELPIKLDYVGKNLPTQADEDVRLLGLDGGSNAPLEVVIVSAPEAGESRALGEPK
jgi:pyrimidine operon attenuation protein/uracil phosphoribosyltransferase